MTKGLLRRKKVVQARIKHKENFMSLYLGTLINKEIYTFETAGSTKLILLIIIQTLSFIHRTEK